MLLAYFVNRLPGIATKTHPSVASKTARSPIFPNLRFTILSRAYSSLRLDGSRTRINLWLEEDVMEKLKRLFGGNVEGSG